MNPYEICPEYETKTYRLRLVRMSDAESLLACYSDPAAVARMNADNCTSDFHYATVDEMRACIAFWLREYEARYYVRFAVVAKRTNQAVGTVEIFGSDFPGLARAGVWRLDLATAHETGETLSELTALAIRAFPADFDIDTLLVKAAHTPERRALFERAGFRATEAFRPGDGYFAYRRLSIACCGLACNVCSESGGCAGCQSGGCDAHAWCKNYNCCKERGLVGCWDCAEFPCDCEMFKKPRALGFARFANRFGAAELLSCLERNRERGARYHYEGRLVGDYDRARSEEELFDWLRNGVR